MADNQKPPAYPADTHPNGGPHYPPNSPAPGAYNQVGPYIPQQEQYGFYGYGYPQYPPQGPYQQGPYQGPYQQPYYGTPPPGMYYQQPYYQQGPPGGYYADRGRSGAGEGICAAVLATLACCCCLDLLF